MVARLLLTLGIVAALTLGLASNGAAAGATGMLVRDDCAAIAGDYGVGDAGKVTCWDRTFRAWMEWDGSMFRRITPPAQIQYPTGFASLNAFIAAAGSTPTVLRLTSDLAVASTVSLPSTITIEPEGGRLIASSTQVLTFASPMQIIGRKAQVFGANLTTGGRVLFTLGGTVYPQWWGATPDGSTNVSALVGAAAQSLPATKAGTLYFTCGPWILNSASTIPSRDDLRITGDGECAKLRSTANVQFLVTTTKTFNNLEVDRLWFEGNNPATGTPPNPDQTPVNLNNDPSSSGSHIHIHDIYCKALSNCVFYADVDDIELDHIGCLDVHACLQSGGGDALGKRNVRIHHNLADVTSNATVTDDAIAVFTPYENVDISHNTLTHRGTAADATFRPHAILVMSNTGEVGTNLSITDNIATGWATTDSSQRPCIEIAGSGGGTLTGIVIGGANLLSDCWKGVRIVGTGTNVSQIIVSPETQVRTTMLDGIELTSITKFQVGGRVSSSSGQGISVNTSSDGTVQDAHVNGFVGAGLFVDASSGVRVLDATAKNGSGGSTDGVFMHTCTDCEIDRVESSSNGRYGYNGYNSGVGGGNTRLKLGSLRGSSNATALTHDLFNFNPPDNSGGGGRSSYTITDILLGVIELAPADSDGTNITLGTTGAYPGLSLTVVNLDTVKPIYFPSSGNQRTVTLTEQELIGIRAITFVYNQATWVQTSMHGGVLPASAGGTGVADLSFSGNTHKACTVTGTLTSGNAVKFDANGNCVDAGVTPGGGGGSTASAAQPTVTTVNAGNAPYTAQATDWKLICDTSAAGRTINLPAASTKQYYKIKVHGANTCTLHPDGSDTIEGVAANYTITLNNASIDLTSDGAAGWDVQ